jgi:hypothetical protein
MRKKLLLIALTMALLFPSFSPLVFAWSDLGGGDHGGLNWTPTDGSQIAGVHDNIDNFVINSGSTVYVAPFSGGYGFVEIRAKNIYIHGILDGTGSGGEGTSSSNPAQSPWGGGGGGYGGAGGGGFGGASCNAAGGSAFGTLDGFDISQGSDGGKGDSGNVAGGKGGAKIILIATELIEVSGSVLANGVISGNAYGGGGSGGGIYLQAPKIVQQGLLEAKGGDSDGNGGGGAGGRIKLFYNNLSGTGTESVVGGQKWPGSWTCSGEEGTVTKIPDFTPPAVFENISGTLGSNGWYVSTVNVTLSVEDLESGVASLEYWVDAGTPHVVPFSTGKNLVSNPSFEKLDLLGNLEGWEKVIGGVATLSQANDEVKFDSYSAKIVSSAPGWASFDTFSSFAPVLNAGVTYTVSGWVKRSGLSGNGAQLRILRQSDGLLVDSSSYVSSDGEWLRVAKNFTPPTSGAYVIEAGLEGTGTVWWDGINLYQGLDEPTYSFVVSGNGTHQVHYSAINNENIKGPTKDSPVFRIDTVSPGNWRDFSLVRPPGANSHTFVASITVDDQTSGLDPGTAYFQYIVKHKTEFGYHSDLENCGSSWIPNDPARPPNVDGAYDPTSGWYPSTVTPNTPGSTTITFSTPKVDFCDDDWADIKKIKFRIKDMAGNSSIREFAVNTAWIQTLSSDVHAEGNIDMPSAVGDNATFMISASSVTNFVSTQNWLVYPYSGVSFPGYDYWFSKIKPIDSLPSGKLPQADGLGVYLVNSGYTIDSNTRPSPTASFTGVVFINGDLTINDGFSLSGGSALVFVVKGKVGVNKQVEDIAGIYLADGLIETSMGGSLNKQLRVKGSLISATGFDLKRSLSNNSTPAEVIEYQPRYLLNSDLAKLFSTSNYSWQEVVP